MVTRWPPYATACASAAVHELVPYVNPTTFPVIGLSFHITCCAHARGDIADEAHNIKPTAPRSEARATRASRA